VLDAALPKDEVSALITRALEARTWIS
jgi:hypothetical protein